MEKLFRFRSLFLTFGSAVILAVLFVTDPDNGLLTGLWTLQIARGIVAVAFAHFARKALFDYLEADLQTLFAQARQSPTGAGLALIAVSIVIFGLLALFGGNARAEVPTRAHTYIPVLKSVQVAQWPDHPYPTLLAGMVHQETCYSDTHSKCWSPLAKLKTSREEGAGLGQLTRTWTVDGNIRFDALQEMQDKHPALRPLNWSNVYEKPELQLLALVLKARDDYTSFATIRSINNRLVFQSAAYNRGVGGIQNERRACQIKDGCDPQVWWGHVELTCTASKSALYGTRSPCQINREHVYKVWEIHTPRYRGLI